MRDVGALDAALQLLATVDGGPTDPVREGEVERLRGQIAFDQRRPAEATLLLLDAASRLDPVDAGAARETYLEALGAAMWADGFDGVSGVQTVSEAFRAAAASTDAKGAVDLVIEALALEGDGRLRGGRASDGPGAASGAHTASFR